ncbi:hypothetical protein ACQEV9_07935 [Streptomyces chartreusis]|uniref:hypothetical protein n=1 Tax=Streptomyces chartreusis TaxID=1969 RepID=UPI003D8A7D20
MAHRGVDPQPRRNRPHQHRSLLTHARFEALPDQGRSQEAYDAAQALRERLGQWAHIDSTPRTAACTGITYDGTSECTATGDSLVLPLRTGYSAARLQEARFR